MQKLSPFFPPLDQLQSTYLRAALLRFLDQAKKNGVLGRDTIIRKTMLDECRGERLEEILAVFSSAVLKRVVAKHQLNTTAHPALAKTLALEKRGYSGRGEDLNPLILAHKVSMAGKLKRKNKARAQYKGFAELLNSKERSISTRRQQLRASAHKDVSVQLSETDRSHVRRAVKTNWSGNERWMETLLHGDAKTPKDGVLTVPFDRVWRRVRSDRLGELEDASGGLLEQLGGRVRIQQDRLGKWQAFRATMFGDVLEPPNKESARRDRQKGIDLGFGAHESLQLGGQSPRKLTLTEPSRLPGEYGELLKDLETDLQNLDRVPAGSAAARLRSCMRPSITPIPSSSSHKAPDEPVSELSELEDEEQHGEPHSPASRPSGTLSKQQPAEPTDSDGAAIQRHASRSSRPKLPQPLFSMPAFRPKSQSTEVSPVEPVKPQLPVSFKLPSPNRSPAREGLTKPPSPTRSPTRPSPALPSWQPSRISPPRRTQSPEELPPSPTQQQADDILASMNAASPSPVKQRRTRHTLSLEERTRLSLARGSTGDLDDDDELDLSPTRRARRNASSRSPKKNKPTTPTAVSENPTVTDFASSQVETVDEGESDLVARTRKSMANFEAAQQKARLERQRSLKRAARQQGLSGSIARQSYFPSVGEEGDAAAGEEDSAVVLEELLAKEQTVDYDAVFRSRPKMRSSPPATPGRGPWPGEDEEEEEEEEEL